MYTTPRETSRPRNVSLFARVCFRFVSIFNDRFGNGRGTDRCHATRAAVTGTGASVFVLFFCFFTTINNTNDGFGIDFVSRTRCARAARVRTPVRCKASARCHSKRIRSRTSDKVFEEHDRLPLDVPSTVSASRNYGNEIYRSELFRYSYRGNVVRFVTRTSCRTSGACNSFSKTRSTPNNQHWIRLFVTTPLCRRVVRRQP